jgi:mono/diheme cytochrome c family protein
VRGVFLQPRRSRDLRSATLPRPLLAGAVAIGVVAVASACGTGGRVSGGDVAHGKQVFTKTCSSCHTLAAAGAAGTIGPNLDNAFSAVRQQGFEPSTIQQVVADQIRVPLQPLSCPNPVYQPKGTQKCAEGSPVGPVGNTVMPANLVSGKDLTDVSAFVARCAGNPTDAACTGGGKITSTDGKTIFLTAGCTGCHTLKDAGSHGTVGPNLDQKKPPESLVVQRVTNGGAIMPPFKSKLTPQQIQAVAKYVSSVAGK